MTRGSGKRSKRSSSSSDAFDDASGDLIAIILLWLMEISLFFRYLIIGGVIMLFWVLFLLFSIGFPIQWWASWRTMPLVIIWGVASIYGLSLDIADAYTYFKFRSLGLNPKEFDIDVQALAGVGPKRVAKLNKIGIYTLQDIARATPEEIVSTGISRKLSVKFINDAKKRIGVSDEMNL